MVLTRSRALGVLLAAIVVLAAVVLAEIIQTIVFAITVAYVLYPVRQWLVQRGVPRRVACAIATGLAFLAIVLLVAPIAVLLYQRRAQLFELLNQLPETVPVAVGDFNVVIEIGPLLDAAQVWIRDIALAFAAAAPGVILSFAVFTFLVYGILYRPNAVKTATLNVIPSEIEDVPMRLHDRTRTTLYSIYVLQATTAAATFVLALGLFLLLGYDAPYSLAVIAGILQFIPVVGPSVLIVGLAANDFLLGAPIRGAAVLVLGLIFVSLVPDAVIRTQLASRTGEISAGLYFVGFVGGILTVGPLGLIVGPLVVSLLVEVVELLSDRYQPVGETEQLSTQRSTSTEGSSQSE